MAKHREGMLRTNKQNITLYQKMNELGHDKFYIELIEEYPCNNIEQLRRKEGEYIRQIGTLYIQIAGRTKQECDNDIRHLRKDVS